VETLRVSPEVERAQVALLASRRADRSEPAVRSALDAMTEAARSGANVIPAMLDAARAEATLGEICESLRAVFGSYTEPAAF
jgi:methylmalonyl-CoA mutase, N-terminal domain